MGFFEKISQGLQRSRNKFRENMEEVLERSDKLDTEFWDGLEESLVMSDMGGVAACKIVLDLEDEARAGEFSDTYGAFDRLYDKVAETFTPAERDILSDEDAVVLFVGINGAGKTTTVGKIAKSETDAGRKVILGSADTFRAAAIEQLEVWAQRANVEVVTRERGSDPASVCYDTIERAEATDARLILIDTAGRLHTSDDLMRELSKVVSVVRKRAKLPVYTLLVIDATTGQNGMQQARKFNDSLDLDGLIVTKLDGSAKGGIALAVSHELGLPIYRIGVGESIDDLRPFDAHDYARALLGDFDEREDKSNEREEEIDDNVEAEELENTSENIDGEVDDDEIEVEEEIEDEDAEVVVEEIENVNDDNAPKDIEEENEEEEEERKEEDDDDDDDEEDTDDAEDAEEEKPAEKKSFWKRLFS